MKLMLGDCLERMKAIPDKSIDMVLCDLPYGTTQNKWDSVIPLAPLWEQYERICKANTAMVFTANQPFTSLLVCSNLRNYKYDWVWDKYRVTGALNAKKQPLRCKEDILVFSYGKCPYYPQGLTECNKQQATGVLKSGRSHSNTGEIKNTVTGKYTQKVEGYPKNILLFPNGVNNTHPTQKPVALLEYLIKTYTLEGETVLDNTMGSGSTGVACVNTGRNFIGIEKDRKYYDIAKKRIKDALHSKIDS